MLYSTSLLLALSFFSALASAADSPADIKAKSIANAVAKRQAACAKKGSTFNWDKVSTTCMSNAEYACVTSGTTGAHNWVKLADVHGYECEDLSVNCPNQHSRIYSQDAITGRNGACKGCDPKLATVNLKTKKCDLKKASS